MKKKLQDLLREKQALTSEQIASFYANRDKFGNALVVNMANRTERLQEATRTLAKVGQSFTRFVAILGKELMETDYHTRFDILRPGELGCLLSHLCILALAADHPDQNHYTVVFEDDVVTSSGRDAYNMALDKLGRIDGRENIQMIYLGKCLERCGQMTQVEDNIYRAVAPSCTHAYAIKNSYAKRILNDLDNSTKHLGSLLNSKYFNRGIDSIYGDYIVHGLAKGLVLHPALFYQDVLGGGSDLRQEFMINYLECNDTSPSCSSNEPLPSDGIKARSRKRDLIVIAILLTVIFIGVLLWQRHRVRRALRTDVGKGTLLFLGALALGIIVVICILKWCMKKDRDRPLWVQDFHAPNQPILPFMLEYCSQKPKDFLIDTRALASREYKVFNPNGLVALLPKHFKSSSPGSWSAGRNSRDIDTGIVTTSRCCNGKVSYPLVQIYNTSLNEILYSKMVLVKSHRSMKSNHILGYEDMRIFEYRKEFYLIGVNLDRSPQNLPGMVLVKLDSNFDSTETWHLKYEPLATVPNKNWSPLILPDGELGFIVDIDPLLIVKRHKKTENPSNDRNGYSEICAKVYQASKQLQVEKIRNSTVTWSWKQLPKAFQSAFLTIFPECSSLHKRYVLMGHTKYVESDFMKDGWRVIYQHYFVAIDLPLAENTSGMTSNNALGGTGSRVHISKAFYVEESDRPHIEYISGFVFVPPSPKSGDEGKLLVMYGLKDEEAKYLELSPSDLSRLLGSEH
jgi:hypothetical protein